MTDVDQQTHHLIHSFQRRKTKFITTSLITISYAVTCLLAFIIFHDKPNKTNKKSIYILCYLLYYFTRRRWIDDVACENGRVKIQNIFFLFRNFYVHGFNLTLVSTCHKLTWRQSPLGRCKILYLFYHKVTFTFYLTCFFY